MNWEVRQGHVLEVLKTLPKESIHMVVTSPPYWGLRSYKTEPQVWGGEARYAHEWKSAPPRRERHPEDVKNLLSLQASNLGSQHELLDTEHCSCGAWRGELGMEPTPELYVQHLVEIFREIKRVMRNDGTLWLNLGDSYTSGGRGSYPTSDQIQYGKQSTHRAWNDGDESTGTPRPAIPVGLKPKDLCGIPWRVAFALQSPFLECLTCHHEYHAIRFGKVLDTRGRSHYVCPYCLAIRIVKITESGWFFRSDIIWAKPNPMPESVKDRPTKTHEYVFLLTKSARYFYDQEAVKTPTQGNEHDKQARVARKRFPTATVNGIRATGYYPMANLRTVWTIPTQAFAEAHFATFPEKLVEPCLRAGTSQHGVCAKCGAPWEREIYTPQVPSKLYTKTTREDDGFVHAGQRRGGVRHGSGQAVQDWREQNPTQTVGWHPTCSCQANTIPATVLDCFSGSGTVGVVALKLGRSFIGIDLKNEYCEMARRRIGKVMPLFEQQPVSNG